MSDERKITSWEVVVRFLYLEKNGLELRNVNRSEVQITIRWPGWIGNESGHSFCVPRAELRRALDELGRSAEELEELSDG